MLAVQSHGDSGSSKKKGKRHLRGEKHEWKTISFPMLFRKTSDIDDDIVVQGDPRKNIVKKFSSISRCCLVP